MAKKQTKKKTVKTRTKRKTASKHSVEQVDLTVRSSQQHAAWQAGRLLNQLKFWTQAAWLTQNNDDQRHADSVWRQLALLARELGRFQREPMQLLEWIEAQHGDWRATLASEAYADERVAATQQLRRLVQARDDSAVTARSVIQQFLALSDTRIDLIRREIRRLFDEQQLLLENLAGAIDCGLHPAEHVTPEVQSDLNSDAPSLSFQFGAARSEDASQPKFDLPQECHPIHQSTSVPAVWRDEVVKLWKECRLSERMLPAVLREPFNGTSDTVGQVVSQIDGAIAGLFGGQLSRKDFLGSCRVRVDMSSDVAWVDNVRFPLERPQIILLKHLVANGTTWTSFASLQRKEFELDGQNQKRLVDSYPPPIRDLIEAVRGAGYRLRPSAFA